MDGFGKGGWNDTTSSLLGAGGDFMKVFDQSGGFALRYEKGNKIVDILAFPGQLAAGTGFTGVDNNGLVYLVMSGNG